jgi:hypothetical protein
VVRRRNSMDLNLKAWFPPTITEVAVEKNGQRHRADLLLSSGWAVEFQNSPIDPETIRERSNFWGKIIWVFNLTDKTPFQFDWVKHYDDSPPGFEYTPKDNYDTFLWRHAKRSLEGLDNFVLDFGVTTFLVKKIYFDSSPTRGWGYLRNKLYFLTSTLQVEREWIIAGEPKKMNWRTMQLEPTA